MPFLMPWWLSPEDAQGFLHGFARQPGAHGLLGRSSTNCYYVYRAHYKAALVKEAIARARYERTELLP